MSVPFSFPADSQVTRFWEVHLSTFLPYWLIPRPHHGSGQTAGIPLPLLLSGYGLCHHITPYHITRDLLQTFGWKNIPPPPCILDEIYFFLFFFLKSPNSPSPNPSPPWIPGEDALGDRHPQMPSPTIPVPTSPASIWGRAGGGKDTRCLLSPHPV